MSEEKVNKDLETMVKEVSNEVQVQHRGRKFEVAREIVPMADQITLAKQLAMSPIVPAAYQRNEGSCYLAVDMAMRMGVSPLFLMQNLHIIQGKPSLSGQFIAALIRSTPSFRNVRLVYVGTPNTDTWGAYVTAEKTSTGEEVKGATITIKTARAEGWMTKNGSKWITMAEMMLAYRAYTWFGRQHAPELLMGLQSSDEIEDIQVVEVEVKDPFVEV